MEIASHCRQPSRSSRSRVIARADVANARVDKYFDDKPQIFFLEENLC